MSFQTVPPTSMTIPPNGITPDPSNIQAVKYYIFNETGNIMVSTTDNDSDKIQQDVRDVFAEVSVFFAAMTKAISSTPNPNSTSPTNYSLYDYSALEKVIDGSGLFIHVTEEDISMNVSSTGVEFSENIIQSLLGLATGSGELSFASAMIASMGQGAVEISSSQSTTDSKVGNIVFVCEYLLGMPIISAIVVYADASEIVDIVKVGPCATGTAYTETWKLHKDTYLFVTPTFIKKFSSDLLSAETDLAYYEFVEFLQACLTGIPVVTSVQDANGNLINNLIPSNTYIILGENFGNDSGTVTFNTSPSQPMTVSSWSPTLIVFTVPSASTPGTGSISITTAGSNSQTGASTQTFTISSPQPPAPVGQITNVTDSLKNVVTSLTSSATYTINGTNLGTLGTVYVGTKSVNLDPSGWTSSSIIITIPDGTPKSSGDTITVTPNGATAITTPPIYSITQ